MLSGTDYKILVRFRAGSLPVDRKDERIKHLIQDGFLCGDEYIDVWYYDDYFELVPKTCKLTIKGVDALEEFERIRKQQTSNESQKANDDNKSMANQVKQIYHDWKIAIFSALIAIILFLIEHIRDVIAFIKSIVHL